MNELIIGILLIGGLCVAFGIIYPVCAVLWEKVIVRSGKTLREICEEFKEE